MEKFYGGVIKHRKKILTIFAIAFVICLFCQTLVSVNYDLNDYLPEDAPSTKAIDVMQDEFDGGIPNVRVMMYDLSIPQALEYKEKLEAIDGVTSVSWLDDVVDINKPLEAQDKDAIEDYYKDNKVLYSVTLEEEKILSGVEDIRALIGDKNAMTGSAVSTAVATTSTIREVQLITVVSVIFVLAILILTTTSWIEPILVLAGLGVAIVINAGSNLLFGEISFVTNSAGNILQLAVSLDYSVFLIHRFGECRKEYGDAETALKEALVKSTSSILSSGLTTVIGFIALCCMRFKIGSDLGIALAKGVAISLITVFIFMPGLILVSYKWMDKSEHKPFLPSFRKFGGLVSKVAIPCAVIFFLFIAPSYLASTQNEYYYGTSHIFGKGTQLGDDTEAIKEAFGKGDTYVLLVPRGDTATETKLADELQEINNVTSIISFVTQAGAEIPYEYLEEGTLSLLESEHYSRMVLNVSVDYEGEETQALVEDIRAAAQKYYPGEYYLAGEGVSTYDLMDTVTQDMTKVNIVAIGAVFLVLLLTLKSISLPIILVLTIETAIWINLSIPYYQGKALFYIAYLIISSIQLGATVDYAILLTDRYKENRASLGKKESIKETISNVTVSVLTSGLTLTVVGFLLGIFSTHGLISQLGYLIGKGTICSLIGVIFILPGFLYILDRTFINRKHEKGALIKEVLPNVK